MSVSPVVSGGGQNSLTNSKISPVLRQALDKMRVQGGQHRQAGPGTGVLPPIPKFPGTLQGTSGGLNVVA